MQVIEQDVRDLGPLLAKLMVRGYPPKNAVWTCGDLTLSFNGMVTRHSDGRTLGFVFHDGDQYTMDFGRYERV